MSRSGYSDSCDDSWQLIMWRGQVASATRGKRGQKLLKDLLAALDEMPEKRLIAHELKCSDGVCALGAVGERRGIEMGKLNAEDSEAVGKAFDIASQLAQEIVYKNDEQYAYCTPEERWQRMRNWCEKQIKNEPRTPAAKDEEGV